MTARLRTLIAAANEAVEFLEGQFDIVDSEFGPRANTAMAIGMNLMMAIDDVEAELDRVASKHGRVDA